MFNTTLESRATSIKYHYVFSQSILQFGNHFSIFSFSSAEKLFSLRDKFPRLLKFLILSGKALNLFPYNFKDVKLVNSPISGGKVLNRLPYKSSLVKFVNFPISGGKKCSSDYKLSLNSLNW